MHDRPGIWASVSYGAFGILGLVFFFFTVYVTRAPRMRDTDIPDFHLRSGVGVAGYGQIQDRPLVGWPNFDSYNGAAHERPRRGGQSGSGESPSVKNKVKGIR